MADKRATLNTTGRTQDDTGILDSGMLRYASVRVPLAIAVGLTPILISSFAYISTFSITSQFFIRAFAGLIGLFAFQLFQVHRSTTRRHKRGGVSCLENRQRGRRGLSMFLNAPSRSSRMPGEPRFRSLLLSRLAGVAWLLYFSYSSAAIVAASNESSLLQECIVNFDPSVHYYQKLLPPDVTNQSFVLPIPLDLQEVDTATGFAVNYGNYYKVVENQFFNLTYLLYQCGAPQPSLLTVNLPATTDARTFQLPLTNLSADSTITVAFLEILGQLGNLSLTSSAYNYTSSSCLVQYLADGYITEISDAGVNSTDVVFTAAGGMPINESNAVSFDATYDGGPLKRAEWIKFLATFLNVEDTAEQLFSYVNRSYQCMNGSMGDSKSKPTIAWLQYSDGVWYFSNATYKLQFDSDAGGVNLDAITLSTSFNVAVGSELDSFHQLLKQLDVVVDETYVLDPYNYTIDTFKANAQVATSDSSLPVFATKQVWRVDKRLGLNDGYDWYESAIPQPHVVLYDMIGILYPSKRWNQTYFRNIAVGEAAIDVSSLGCNYSFGQARALGIIPDPDVMKCVGDVGNVPSESFAISPSPWSFSLFMILCTMLILAKSRII